VPNYSSLVSIAVNTGEVDQVGVSPRCGKVAYAKVACVDTTTQTARKEDVRSRSRDVAVLRLLCLPSNVKREHVKWCMSF
jgi:hypothetical protein